MERLNLEVKLAANDVEGTITGYASPFGGEPDSYGDIIAKGAFAKSLANHKADNTNPLMLWQHNQAEPIGVWLDVHEDAYGLAVKGRLILDTQRGREAYALLKAGALNGLSIGFRTIDFDRRAGGGRVLKTIDLIEISPVSVPAASRARITDVKTAQADNPAALGAAFQRSKADMAVQTKAPAPEAETEDVTARVTALEETVTGIDTRLQAVEASVGDVAKSAARIELKLNRPGASTEAAADPAKFEAKAFVSFLRSGREAMSPEEVKALSVAPDTAGGYLAPADFVAEVVKGIVDFSPVRQAARVGQTAAAEVQLPRRTGRPTARWSGETEDRVESSSTYGQIEIAINEMTAFTDVSQRLLEDSAINVESEVAFDLAEEFGRLEGVALVNGDGVKKPLGFMTDSTVTAINSGAAATLGTNPADTLIGFLYALSPFYRANGAWMMNGSTLATIRRLKDTTGQYLWQPSLQEGQPETILGRPVIEAPDMASIGANAEPIAFGDFNRGYRIYDRVSMSVMRDPYTVATKGLVRYHARRRVGGAVVLAEAIRKLRCAV
ncbi:phage major capsid protein [Aquidulcibacter sp.]|uniref:phage major capsid protein n=1 Tax=Aquidulcibacter sp. TaxID=2052990 RepID=UPI003BA5AD4D